MCKCPDKFVAPGSESAISAGCTCPILDNRHGKGMYIGKDGIPQFIFSADCPIHGWDFDHRHDGRCELSGR